MANDLRIQIVVDAAQLTAGMSGATATVDAATARIKAAFGSIANAPEGIQNALKVLENQSRMSSEAVNAATSAIGALGGTSSEAAAKMTGMDRAMATATGRMVGMASGAGMLGGALGRVAAASSTLGPILATAFPVVAVAALVDIVALAYDKIIEVTSAWAGWDKEAQQMYDQLVSLNQQTVAFNANLAIEKLRLNEIGLKGVALDIQKEKDLTAELTIRKNELADSLAREASIRNQLAGNPHDVEVQNPETGLAETVTDATAPGKDEVTRLNKELTEARANTQKLQEEIAKLKEVSIPAEQKTEGKDRAAEAEKAAELNDKLVESTKRLAEADLKEFEAKKRLEKEADQAFDKNDTTDQDIRDMRLRDDADEASTQAQLDRQKAAALTGIEIQQERVKEQARLGQISTQDEVAQLNALEAQKLQIEKAYVQQRMDTILARIGDDSAEEYKKDKAEWDKLLNDKQKAEDTYQKNRQKNLDSAANTESKTWTTLMSRINSAFDQSIQGLIKGTMTFGKAFASLLDNLLADFVSFLAKKVEKWAEEQLLELALHSTFLTNILGLETASNAAKQAENSVAASLAVTQQAGVAGAGAFASVMASLPFPVNVATAPGVMAAAIATTLGNLSLASAAGGYDVPEDMLAMVHANEMILPANLSSGIKNLIGNGKGAGSGDVHVNFQVNAVDASGVESFFHRNQAALVKTINTAIRRSNQG